MRGALLVLLALVAACADEEAERAARRKEAEGLLLRLDQPAAFARAVELADVEVLALATREPYAESVRCQACLALGRVGSEAARARLAEIVLTEEGPVRRCAYAGLSGATPEEWRSQLAREAEAQPLVDKLEEGDALDRVVKLRAVGPLIEATRKGKPERGRRLACIALGEIGGAEARDRLLELLAAPTPDPERDGAVRLYAASGLTILKDPGTAIDLLLQLSRINPNDNVAALAAEGTGATYYTVDAQICEALLAMGLWNAEEELIEQMKRRDYVRVLIDAHAVLRRHTGLELPFRYNGSYADRDADADAWLAKLRETRAQREQQRPFDSSNPRFRAGCQEMMRRLGGVSVNDRYVAEKVVARLGRHAIPFLVEELAGSNASAQREAALMLGRIGHPDGVPALRTALALADADARATAIDALRRIGDARSRELVAARLRDGDPEVRADAAHYLAELGGAGDRPALEAALANEQAPATIAALRGALLRLGDEAQVPPLLEIFLQGEQMDREVAYAALETVAAGAWKADPLAPREARAAAAARFPKR